MLCRAGDRFHHVIPTGVLSRTQRTHCIIVLPALFLASPQSAGWGSSSGNRSGPSNRGLNRRPGRNIRGMKNLQGNAEARMGG
mmetsp:Transcript_20523/g.57098  ORF Transcript_20523/g.57098 Transcript_20523/m.57098 type:complete len:83 (-) Transcript_20523:393-641(-)